MAAYLISNNRDIKQKSTNGNDAFRTISELDNAQAQLSFWEMKGLTLTQVENTYGFDFVVGTDCSPVLRNGQFVIVRR